MRRFIKPKIVVLGAIATLAVAGAAVAYFSTTGAGTGSASVGHNSALVLHGTVGSALYPGTSSAVSFTADNPSSGHQHVNTIHLASIKACSSGGTWTGSACSTGSEITTCESAETAASDTNTANFWMPDVTVNQDVPSGNAQALTAGGTLTMNNLSSSQDTCQSATLTLNFTSS